MQPTPQPPSTELPTGPWQLEKGQSSKGRKAECQELLWWNWMIASASL